MVSELGKYSILHLVSMHFTSAHTASFPTITSMPDIYHFLVSDFSRYLERTSVHASVTSLRRPMFLRYPVALPPLESQRRIAQTLDNFDALTNDLSIGLPAELEARRNQYAYYRDKLLTFPEKV